MLRSIDDQKQELFSRLSGDYNPIHTDAIAARRLIFGRQVVHGIHLLLIALECCCEKFRYRMSIEDLVAIFHAPVGVDEEIDVHIVDEIDGKIKIKINKKKTICVQIIVKFGEAQAEQDNSYRGGCPPVRACTDLSAEELNKASGDMELYLDLEIGKRLFPFLVNSIHETQLAEILASTRLVGMECPGKNSIFSEFKLNLKREQDFSSKFGYEVRKFDRRFNLLNITYKGVISLGKIMAFLRPEYQPQVEFSTLPKHLKHREFSNQKVLVIGGSRGLGEVTTKILAAGGADVRFTYFKGYRDAKVIENEIKQGGGRASCYNFDLKDVKRDLSAIVDCNWFPTHFYYFATPFIFCGTKKVFNSSIYNEFCKYYVHGFNDLIDALNQISRPFIKVFYPSSVAIDELPEDMGEYVSAKIAGEYLCKILAKTRSNLDIIVHRLPRLATDQTVNLYGIECQDPIAVLKKIVKNMN
jgi:hypothetical protein